MIKNPKVYKVRINDLLFIQGTLSKCIQELINAGRYTVKSCIKDNITIKPLYQIADLIPNIAEDTPENYQETKDGKYTLARCSDGLIYPCIASQKVKMNQNLFYFVIG